MRKALLSGFIAIATLCACAQSKRPQLSEGPEAPYLKVIDAKCKELAKLGHVPKHFNDCASLIGQYQWHGNGSGYFGTYEFYPLAFEQAKRGWWGFHGTVIEGGDELWVEDNTVNEWCTSSGSIGTLQPGESASISVGGSNSTCGHDPYPIVFDSSVIGRTISHMSWVYVDNKGKYVHGDFGAKIIAIIDNGKNLKLSSRAPHHADQWNMSIRPEDYVDMCDCTNNFHPPFVDGHPVVN